MAQREVEFEFVDELPAKTGRGRDWLLDAFAEALKARPGQWARWPKPLMDSTAKTYVSAIGKGRLRPFPVGEFEAVVRFDVLYVRYVGEVPDDAA
ncbi:hypothetical protein NDR87_18900 [Nocardia sp. CDC159]|uniref:Uncharacterized protein n=1 Tax=Nocardia pulmonis TaxID=2951408 RepID=A0A9X2E9S2_9NOCA|nr:MULTISPECIES: hypothetical protein [Nocardia]MCM6776240.1 hypothetical protein [Nocardia pulmonis]MCM6788434.1 hypothetical protein [Nocardia sp. CDC159]